MREREAHVTSLSALYMVLYVCPTEIETKRGAAERQHYRLEQEGHSVCVCAHNIYCDFHKTESS